MSVALKQRRFFSLLLPIPRVLMIVVLSLLGQLTFSIASPLALAQEERRYDVARPRVRAVNERVTIRTKAVRPSIGVLAVILDPVINGQVLVKDESGRIIDKKDAGDLGQAEFQLPRGKSYLVEASSPNYLNASGQSKILKTTEIVRLQLIPQFATLKLENFPASAQVFIDDQLRAAVDLTGTVAITQLDPGEHSLTIHHPEYNDYSGKTPTFKAGETITYRIPLIRVAKLTIEGPPGATVLIDGAVQGKVKADGIVRIDYELEKASEYTISVDLGGYQPWSRRELLKPGPRTFTVKLDPIITAAGVSDLFENLSLWNAPPSWKINSNSRNKWLEVKGEQIGLLKDKIYRNFVSEFTIWLNDGKGATWVVRADKEGHNYYLFHLSGPKSTTHTPKRFYTYLVKDGGEPIEVSTPIPLILDLADKSSNTDVNDKSTYTIRIEARDHVIEHSITSNDTGEKYTLGIWTDTTSTKEKFLYGTFGFCSLKGETFSVYEFHIEPTKAP